MKHYELPLQVSPKQQGMLLGFPESLQYIIRVSGMYLGAYCKKEDADYAAIAANNYPKLKEALRNIIDQDYNASLLERADELLKQLDIEEGKQ